MGGGALFFIFVLKCAARSQDYYLDVNLRLIRTYRAIRDDVEGVIVRLQHHASITAETIFMQLEMQVDTYDNDADVAAWFIYLNKTAFNGLYRVNKKNRFNAPMGKYKNPTICDAVNLHKLPRCFANS